MTQDRENLVQNTAEVRESVLRGSEQSAADDVVYLGSFAQYA